MAYFHTILIGAFALALSACASEDEPNGPDLTTPLGTPDLDPLPPSVALPIVFVHGFAGSAQQYESQAIRFAANGYPRERIVALDHDGAGVAYATYVSQVDELVDQVRTRFGVEQVYLVGHSRGTRVSSQYMFEPTRRAKVAKYVSLDGFGCNMIDEAGTTTLPLPAEIPCVAPTQAILEGQAHVEVATSADSFKMQYEFLVGTPPTVVDIVRQDKPVELTGRLVNFPANVGRAGATLEIWEINSDTGHRVGAGPVKTFAIDDTGDWGPVVVSPDKRYEMAAVLPDSGTQHFYPPRFLRSSHLVRLLSGAADSPIRLATNRGPNHAAVIAIRMREWYSDPNPDPSSGSGLAAMPRAADTMDVLEVGTTSPGKDQSAVNIIAPRMTNGDIAIHIHDDTESAGVSTLEPLSPFLDPSCLTCTAFQTTTDLFMPGTDPPDGTITFSNIPRGDSSKPQILTVPNWASSNHLITLLFSDYPQ